MAETILPRRQFLRGKFLTALQSEREKTQGFNGIRPPWAVAETAFVAECSRCGDCVRSCETGVLIVGAGGFPEIDFTRSECTFCGHCATVCRQPVFRALDEPAWPHKIEIQSFCLTFRGVECRACEDNCESRAIRFKREIGGIAKPQVNVRACNGCGACLRVCPVSAVKILKELTTNE
ncbi:ferredoxin-type protein NapF [Actinobacillus succinogenes]|uniref:Ferredoxin-type protein NapF n=1 Tax=Actinobacillus succinogenes (strain ATCC 55618 / DSM 22257 / CCUG 43843 / 130Z) TaxID=339671 RepID=A6VQY9_ACTSZ|nr:ferredoxin-type protein NapF [Actinobacillus succinogenes]ABR75386.1 ferredoxin-type protein NapF [Actinobacillus succinogenes 130Z]PHI40226.1 ferredoxin-type protein NapF [Actinobacillus succinogenes]